MFLDENYRPKPIYFRPKLSSIFDNLRLNAQF